MTSDSTPPGDQKSIETINAIADGVRASLNLKTVAENAAIPEQRAQPQSEPT